MIFEFERCTNYEDAIRKAIYRLSLSDVEVLMEFTKSNSIYVSLLFIYYYVAGL